MPRSAAFFALAFIVYLAILPWSATQRPPDGDAPHYLLLTHSLAFDFDTDLDGASGDGINLDTLEFYNYGNDDRSVATFAIDIQVSGGAWQAVEQSPGDAVFEANMDSNGQSWPIGPFHNGSIGLLMLRIRGE